MLVALAAGGPASAQVLYDPAQLPAIPGRVAQYSLTPHGDVDGLILEDGMEVHLPPYLGTQLVSIVHAGDAVTIHGLRARAIPMVQALSITNDATGRSVSDTGGSEGATAMPPEPGTANRQTSPLRDVLVQGVVRSRLHGPRGDLNGVLLTDGTIIRLPPPEALRLAAQLQPGMTLAAQGSGTAGLLGRAIAATRVGPDAARLVPVATRPRPGMPR